MGTAVSLTTSAVSRRARTLNALRVSDTRMICSMVVICRAVGSEEGQDVDESGRCCERAGGVRSAVVIYKLHIKRLPATRLRRRDGQSHCRPLSSTTTVHVVSTRPQPSLAPSTLCAARPHTARSLPIQSVQFRR